MKINILTIFPDFFKSPLMTSIIKRAISSEIIELKIVDIRSFATDKHRLTDDRPFGGGPGMVMKIEPIDLALKSLNLNKDDRSKVLLTSAKGRLFNQDIAQDYSKLKELTIICGHYEGVDERVAENLIDQEIRIGDYVLTGGEPATLVIIDAIIRLIPGALGNEASNKEESHSIPGKLGFPQYTRPKIYNSWKVPDVLTDGNHQKVDQWRNSKVKSEQA